MLIFALRWAKFTWLHVCKYTPSLNCLNAKLSNTGKKMPNKVENTITADYTMNILIKDDAQFSLGAEKDLSYIINIQQTYQDQKGLPHAIWKV